ncbi:DUF2461 domain-containing protein [Arcticibacter eurypsychrophilus]|uniref:DUF2461 domain-containing protein n=1 Tax=Arcticibacter eurypsychrophilus TaxID=1434752 RepID=UPI00084D7BE3|nr:DUF2461 domain-containing protein [Arcticibacter eurypsychrophilus]
MIQQSTFNFLKSVAENNNREWFKDHKQEHDAAREDVFQFAQDLIKGVSAFDSTVPKDLDPKTCVMRIYRDVRFSLDKLPYKTNFGIGISSLGKNFPGPGYYLHIQPGASFIAGGSWYPEANELKAIRQEIDYNTADWHHVIDQKDLINSFGELGPEHKLKTSPKGYPKDHPEMEYLKLKSFIFSKQLTDKELLKPSSPKDIAELAAKIFPFMVFLRKAIS